MSLLDWVFIGTLSSAILCILFSLVIIVLLFSSQKQIKQCSRLKIRNPKKRKIIKMKYKKAKEKYNKHRRHLLFFFFLSASLTSGAFYARYYQATNLGEKDSEGIVQGYYLLDETKNQISQLQEEGRSEKAGNNLRELAAKLSSFGMRGADGRLTEEGQRLLTRYYNQVKELGLNLNNQSVGIMENKEHASAYITDIKKVQLTQRKIISYFKINEQALKQKK